MNHDPIPVLALHGVGMCPELFEPTIAALSGVPCLAPRRLGYRDADRPHSLDDMVDDVVSMIERHGPLVVVGVSGGATLALAAALRAPAALRGVVAHEPLVGPLAPALHRMVAASADLLAADPEPAAVAGFVQRLVGVATWEAMTPAARGFADLHAEVVRGEVPHFVGFAPSAADLSTLRAPITVSTGEHSIPARHEVARVLVSTCAAAGAVVPDAGHLAHWENPVGFASIVRDHLDRTLGHP